MKTKITFIAIILACLPLVATVGAGLEDSNVSQATSGIESKGGNITQIHAMAGAEDDNAPQLAYALTLDVAIDGAYGVGKTSHGNRFIIPITGGTFHGVAPDGSSFSGEVLAGGADYQLQQQDLGRTELQAIYSIRTSDGVSIHVRNEGIIVGEGPSTYFFTSPRFEAPADSKYAWLSNAIFVCRPDFGASKPGTICLKVWRVK